MYEFCVRMAELPIGIAARFASTQRFLSAYRTEEQPLFSVAVSPEDIQYERDQSALQNELDGRPVVAYSDAYLETLSLLRKIANRLYAYDAVLFHGAAVAVDGRAYLFTAPSGTGKTTHVRLWLEQIPRAYVLNGDKPFLRLRGEGVLVCGNPWQGKENYGRNEILPLGGLCLLERGAENRIRPIRMDEALGALTRQTHLPLEAEGLLATVRVLGEIAHRVPLYRLQCNMEPEAARISARAMLGGETEAWTR